MTDLQKVVEKTVFQVVYTDRHLHIVQTSIFL